MFAIPTIEAERLRLRPPRLDDFDAYVRMWQEPGVVRFIGGAPFTREQSWGRFARHIGLWSLLGFGYFVIELKATGEFAGCCGFQDQRRDLTPSLEGTMEAGWALTTAMQGQGLAQEAMRAAIGWGDAHGRGERMTALIDVDHAASLRVADKLGFTEFARTAYAGKPVVLLERRRR